MIHVLATIEVTDGKRDQFLKHFNELVPQVLAEEGCIAYGPAVDLQTNLPVQPPVRPNIVTVIEQWDDLPALGSTLDGAAHGCLSRRGQGSGGRDDRRCAGTGVIDHSRLPERILWSRAHVANVRFGGRHGVEF